MATKPSEITKKIKQFLREFEKSASIESVHLFGSHALGTAKKDSDIDLAVVSPVFASMELFDRLVFLGKVAWRAGTPEIEAIGYTHEEFFNAPPWEFASEVRKNGKTLPILWKTAVGARH